MARTVRTRSYVRTFSGYRIPTKYGVPGTPALVTVSRSQICSDAHGRPIADSNFDVSGPKSAIRINGHIDYNYGWGTIGNGTTYQDYPLACWSGLTINDDPLGPPSGWYLDVVARTNPSRPVLTPPTLIQDLLDLPKMLRSLKDAWNRPQSVATPKGIANGYLSAIFGWLPLVDDIKQILDVQRLAIIRSKELQHLYSASGLRRRVFMGESHEVEARSNTFASYGTGSVTLPITVGVAKKSWATIHWKPTTPPPFHPDDVRWNKLCRRLVLGMTSEGLAKGLWDVIPWTWLIGWFTNVGKYTLAYSNTVPASHSGACFMSQVTVTGIAGVPVAVGLRSNSLRISGYSSFVRKKRTVSGALTPGFHMPFLDMWRLSVLSALTVQRVMR